MAGKLHKAYNLLGLTVLQRPPMNPCSRSFPKMLHSSAGSIPSRWYDRPSLIIIVLILERLTPTLRPPQTNPYPSTFTTSLLTTKAKCSPMPTRSSSSSTTNPTRPSLIKHLHLLWDHHLTGESRRLAGVTSTDSMTRYVLACYLQSSNNITIDSTEYPADRLHFNLTDFADKRGDLTLLGATYFYLGPQSPNGPSSNASSTF